MLRRASRAPFVLVAVILLTSLFALVRPPQAWAASDRVDRWSISYTVNPDGTVDATETLVYRFGSTSQRHGIQRFLTIREPWDDQHDAVYDISNVRVTSPDAPSNVAKVTDDQGRNQFLVLRIGSQTQTITAPTATYTISYRIAGAMRHSPGYDEFYWDAISGETPQVSNISVEASVPGGVQQVSCFVGTPQGKGECTSADISSGRGSWTQQTKTAAQVMTIGAKVGSGLVSDPNPHLVTRADAGDQLLKRGGMAAGALSALLSPIAGLLWWRRRGRDLRYVGLPPGVLPANGQVVPERPSGPVEIPVAFSPPHIPVAEAGLLADGVIDTTETTATLVELAVQGAVRLSSDPGDTRVELVDPSRATQPHQQVLLDRLFRDGQVAELGTPGSLLRGHVALVTSVRNQVALNRWFTDLPKAGRAGAGFVLLGGLLFFAFVSGATGSLLWLALPLLPIALVASVLSAKRKRGQRTGLGRALTDQVEGFRTYLATAEADQLRFEEGEDIFSRYLPWAILFGLTERWADICAQLVREGRLSAAPPTWYAGDYANWNFYVFTNSLDSINRSALPQVSMPSSGGSSGSGWGSGTSFGGGGFAGGGGGGGGVGSW